MDRPLHSPLVQTTFPWAPTTWKSSSITAVAETGLSPSDMPLQSSPSQVTTETVSKLQFERNDPVFLSFQSSHHDSSLFFAPSLDQVPFTISLAQINDVNQNDQNFIQNQAIGFTVNIHDPSQYLNNAEISFTWDFGDNSGTLISREHMVTHAYIAAGTFRPQVVLMASIPNNCGNPTAGEISELISLLFTFYMYAVSLSSFVLSFSWSC